MSYSKELVNKVFGGLIMLLLSIMGFLLGNLHGDVKLLRLENERTKADVEQAKGELKDFWGKYNQGLPEFAIVKTDIALMKKDIKALEERTKRN